MRCLIFAYFFIPFFLMSVLTHSFAQSSDNRLRSNRTTIPTANSPRSTARSPLDSEHTEESRQPQLLQVAYNVSKSNILQAERYRKIANAANANGYRTMALRYYSYALNESPSFVNIHTLARAPRRPITSEDAHMGAICNSLGYSLISHPDPAVCNPELGLAFVWVGAHVGGMTELHASTIAEYYALTRDYEEAGKWALIAGTLASYVEGNPGEPSDFWVDFISKINSLPKRKYELRRLDRLRTYMGFPRWEKKLKVPHVDDECYVLTAEPFTLSMRVLLPNGNEKSVYFSDLTPLDQKLSRSAAKYILADTKRTGPEIRKSIDGFTKNTRTSHKIYGVLCRSLEKDSKRPRLLPRTVDKHRISLKEQDAMAKTGGVLRTMALFGKALGGDELGDMPDRWDMLGKILIDQSKD